MKDKTPYSQRDHRHCFVDQAGHEKHLTCCLCSVPQVPHKPECCKICWRGDFCGNPSCPCHSSLRKQTNAPPDLSDATPTTSETEQGDWEDKFDAQFNFFKDITITVRDAGTYEKAQILQQIYRSTGEQIKSFIRDTLATEREKARLEGVLAATVGDALENPLREGYQEGIKAGRNSLLEQLEEAVQKVPGIEEVLSLNKAGKIKDVEVHPNWISRRNVLSLLTSLKEVDIQKHE